MAHVYDIRQLRFSRRLPCGTDPENTKGFGVRWIWFPKVFPFLEKIGMGQRKPLMGAVVEGEQFSPTG